MKPLKKFFEQIQQKELENKTRATIKRFRELAGIDESHFLERYAIQVIVSAPEELLLEHEQYDRFKKSTDLMMYHPENPAIPVRAHYHVLDGKSKAEKYAVNLDGTAHHKKNRGHVVPKRQADELRAMGVKIPNNNILECLTFSKEEYPLENTISYFFIVE